MIVPELNGNPREFTAKISVLAKNDNVYGSKNLKMNIKIAKITTLAIMKFLVVTFFCFLKKYNIPIEGKANKAMKCTPNESPITKEIKINHLSLFVELVITSIIYLLYYKEL